MSSRGGDHTGRVSTIERTVQQSIIERLTDDSAAGLGDRAPTWESSVLQLKRALRRDLEWLLNTRRIAQPVPADCEELAESLYNYGLPDIATIGRNVSEARFRLAHEVEAAIALFEPRLSGARVSFVEGTGAGDRRLHFVIEALLRMDPTPEHVVFDTTLDPSRGEFEVRTDAQER